MEHTGPQAVAATAESTGMTGRRKLHTAAVRLADGSVQMTKVLRLQDLRLPIHIALGRHEAATEEELNDLITDLTAELTRRESPRAA